MNFSGWVAFRRSFLEHTMDGSLSNQEALVLFTLILLADSKTGRGMINAAAIRTFLPELDYHAAKKILKSLEDKRYIWRKIKHRSKALYPYWVNRYEITQGPHKSFQIDLSQVFDSRDSSDIRYVNPTPAGAPQTLLESSPQAVPQAVPEGVPYNNKDHYTENQQQERNNASIKEHDVKASLIASEAVTSTAESTHADKGEAIMNASAPASSIALPFTSPECPAPIVSASNVVPTEEECETCGFTSSSGHYYDAKTGEELEHWQVKSKIIALRGQRRVEQDQLRYFRQRSSIAAESHTNRTGHNVHTGQQNH